MLFLVFSLCCLRVNRMSWRGGDDETLFKKNSSPYKHPSRNTQSTCAQWVPTRHRILTIGVGAFWVRVITCIDVSFLGSTAYSWQAGTCSSFWDPAGVFLTRYFCVGQRSLHFTFWLWFSAVKFIGSHTLYNGLFLLVPRGRVLLPIQNTS